MAQINYNSKKSSLFSDIAKQIATSIKSTLKKKEWATIAFPGGRSAAEVFDKLLLEDIDWTKVHLFMVDERLVPLESPDSNYKILQDNLTDFLLKENKINQENIHPFIANSSKGDFGAGSYFHDLNELGGSFDIVVLSSGEDGHIAGIFPQHHSMEDGSEGFITFNDSPKNPADRMSASRKLINRSTVAILIFIDDAKRNALDDFNSESKGVLSCPAKLVLNIHDHFVYTNIKA